MVEIGAGGSSVAHLDQLGRIAVGPRSTGSEPGPASYGAGGHEATGPTQTLFWVKLCLIFSLMAKYPWT